MLPSYPKIWNLGHPSLQGLFEGEVVLQEKIDGSQFSFAALEDGNEVTIAFRSKGAEVIIGAAGMFTAGVEAVLEISGKLTPGWVYRGEYLAKPKHNALAYSRVPARHVILFDVTTGPNTFLGPEELAAEANRLGLEAVPRFIAEVHDLEHLQRLIDRESILGGPKMEGVVIKNYARFHTQTSDTLMGKLVSSDFREVHKGAWKIANPQKADIVDSIARSVSNERRWEKAVERARDAFTLTDSPKDIGALMRSVANDVETECKEEISEALFKWAWPQIQRRLTGGLPEWYKKRLLVQQDFKTLMGTDEPA